MLAITLGVALTLILIGRALIIHREHGPELGIMSHSWVTAHHAAQTASSF